MRPRSGVALLHAHAESRPDDHALRLKSNTGWTTFTWSEYYDSAVRAASVLRIAGVKESDHVLIIDLDPLRSIPALFGLWLLGAVPILATLPDPRGARGEYNADYLRNLSRRLDVQHVLIEPSQRGVKSGVSELRFIPSESIVEAPRVDNEFDSAAGGDIALIQLTSGTTGDPRGIVIRHDQLMAHLDSIAHALPVGQEASAASWLPLHHDMGLYGSLLFPLKKKIPTTLMSPVAFRRRPLIWLEAIDEFKATCTGAPPSAYAILLRMAQRVIDAGLRFDHVECAMIGAEHIPADLLRTFARSFAPCGFRENTFMPAYGLAECTVAVTFSRLEALPRIDVVDMNTLTPSQNGHSTDRNPRTLEFVGSGRSIEGTELKIVDDEGVELPDRALGEIRVRSNTGMACYYRDEDATQEVFENAWLKTGDLGYLVDGELFVVGRKKDLIIKGGQNFSPAAIEAAVESVDGVRPGAAAAVGLYSDQGMTEAAFVVVECPPANLREPTLEQSIRVHLLRMGFPVDRIVFVRPRTLPRTTSGKVKRGALADMIRLGQVEHS